MALEQLKSLDVGTKCQAEYVWIDGSGGLRSKGRTLDSVPRTIADLPKWNYDGSSTEQAPGEQSEVLIYPQAMYPDPFRGNPNVIVMCDTYDNQGNPLPTNTRHHCAKVMEKAVSLEPWFGIEQEFFLMKTTDKKPLGFPENGYPRPQGPYYCSVGAENIFGRDVAEAHWRACIFAGIKISGINAEVAPGQWEFQIGPTLGMEQGDMMWVARYLLGRVCEIAGCEYSLEPKPVKGDWNGSGGHTNFSTKPMREAGGYEKHILPAMEKLKLKHSEHIAVYGEGNAERLTGKHETASIEKFTYGVGSRACSARIGNDVAKEGKGYFEDRRPASNFDPYLVTMMVVSTTCDIPLPAGAITKHPYSMPCH
jgi:glutamine synthetase